MSLRTNKITFNLFKSMEHVRYACITCTHKTQLNISIFFSIKDSITELSINLIHF